MFATSNPSVYPLVFDNAIKKRDWIATLQLWDIPLEWRNYAKSCDMTEHPLGHFQVVANLGNFLKRYQHSINNPKKTSDFSLLFSFLVRINAENTRQINNLHLAKVIVLLQLLADPNLSAWGDEKKLYFLHSLFEAAQIGLDGLNLLFSYGLTYEIFSLNLFTFIKKYISFHVSHEQIVGLLQSQNDVKDAFNEETRRRIYRKILDIIEDNPYTRIYEYLRMAYLSYQQESYQQAAEFYQQASERLTDILSSEEELTPAVRQDYAWRQQESERYAQICSRLSSQKKTSRIDSQSRIISEIPSLFFGMKDEPPSNDRSIKYKKS